MESRAAAAGRSGTPVHLTYLDGVRGVSILLVLFFHERVHLPDHAVAPLDIVGAYGVDLFFVLSGCCLAMPYLRRRQTGASNEFDLAAYVARRVLRILPAFAAAVALLALASWLPAIHDRVPALGAVAPVSLGDALAQLLFFDRDVPLLNPSFWSLALEWRWYAVFPLALALWTRAPRVVLAFAGAAVGWSLLDGGASRDLAMIDAFLLGILAAELALGGRIAARRAALWFFASLVVAVLLGRGTYFPVQTNPAWHLVAFAFVVWAGAEPRLRALLELRWLAAIGRVAYSTYLIHEPIVRAIELAAVPRFGDGPAMAFATAAALAAGFGLAHLVELPLQRRAVVAAVVDRARPRLARFFAFAGLPERFAVGPASAIVRHDLPDNVIDLRARAALRAVS